MGRRGRSSTIKTTGKKSTPLMARSRIKSIKPKITKAKAKAIIKSKIKAAKQGPKGKPKTPLKSAKALFEVDEKVLCYEPDPTKAKMIYDAKVLQLVRSENRGKPVVEYLIHFLGWNSSWDRVVSESSILKDDETSRALQLKLAEDAEAMFEASGKSTKKRGRTIADLVRASLKGNSCEDPEPKAEPDRSSTEEESAEEPDDDMEVNMAIPHAVRMAVDLDYFLINKYDKLTQLPAEPNIVQILEEYVRHFGFKQLAQWVETITASTLAEWASSQQGANKSTAMLSNPARKPEAAKRHPMEKLYNRLRVVKEVVDGVRILIDFLISTILLYEVERAQFEKCDDKEPHYHPLSIKPEDVEIKIVEEPRPQPKTPSLSSKGQRGRGRGRSSILERPTENGPVNAPLRKLAVTMNPLIKKYKTRLLKWALVPPSLYDRVPSLPSLIYGPNHLLRLFVKLPEVFSHMTIPKRKLRIIIHYVSDLIDFVIKRGFCGPHLYVPAKNALKRVGRRRRQLFVPVIRVEQIGSDEEQEMPDLRVKVEK